MADAAPAELTNHKPKLQLTAYMLKDGYADGPTGEKFSSAWPKIVAVADWSKSARIWHARAATAGQRRGADL